MGSGIKVEVCSIIEEEWSWKFAADSSHMPLDREVD
jgi:hypothetical protein